MARIELAVNGVPQLHIEHISGSLHLKGHDEDTVRIEAASEEGLKYQLEGDQLTLSCDTDCMLRVPSESALTIGRVSRDAYIHNVEGEVNIEKVNGSLTLRSVGEAQVEEVYGSLTARGIQGDLSVEKVYGNAIIRNVEGDLQARVVHANLELREVEGSITAKSMGNAELRLADIEGDIHIEAAANIFCDFRDGADADLHMESAARHIQVTTKNQKNLVQAASHDLTLGGGGSSVHLRAGGQIDLRSRGQDDEFLVDLDIVDDIDNLAEEITGQVTQQIESQMEALNHKLNSLSERLSHTGSRTASRVQERMARAQRKLEMKLAKRRGPAPAPANKASEPVDSKERAIILNMLQDKKISIDEAEMLLHALEGRPVVTPPAPPAAPQAPEAPASPSTAVPPVPAEEDNA